MGGRGGSSHRASAGGNVARFFLENTYGAQHANRIMALLQQAPAHIQEMWERYGYFFRGSPLEAGQTAHYSTLDDAVHLNIHEVAFGDSISTPYSVLFHEYGHMTDYLIGSRGMGGRSQTYSSLFAGLDADGKPILQAQLGGGLLGRTAKSELEGHLYRLQRQNPSLSRSELSQKLASEAKRKYSKLDRSDISDMMEGAGIGIAFPLEIGHGLNYWIARDNGKEIFAEMVSAEAAHPGSLRAIKDYFPQTYGVYQDMMKGWRRKKK